MESPGIVYLIQPNILIGTDRYKIGCSGKNNLQRIKSYGDNTRIIAINECDNPFLLEKQLKCEFTKKFKILSGKEYFIGDSKLMEKEFLETVFKYKSNLELNKKITLCDDTKEYPKSYTLYYKNLDDTLSNTILDKDILYDFLKQNYKILKIDDEDYYKYKILSSELFNNFEIYFEKKFKYKISKTKFGLLIKECGVLKDYIKKNYEKNLYYFGLINLNEINPC